MKLVVGSWRSQNSIADPSTTTTPILDLIAGECWARCQLRSDIKDLSVPSELMKSLTLVRVVFMDSLAIPGLNGRFLHNHCSDPGSYCGRLLGLTPATQRYKVRPEAPIPPGATIGFQEGGLLGGGETCLRLGCEFACLLEQ